MSVEEWPSFHANPTIEALTPELVSKGFKKINPCKCSHVTDVIYDHVPPEKCYEFLLCIRKLGFEASSAFFLDSCWGGYEKCVKYIIAGIVIPDKQLILEMSDYYSCGDSEFIAETCGKLLIEFADRYPKNMEPLKESLPEFICVFLGNRIAAASGAIHTMHVLKKMVGKDAARIIGRVVWSERKNYHLDRPNKK